MESQVNLNYIIFAVVGIILLLIGGVFLIFTLAVKNKNRLLLEQKNAELAYSVELNKMKIELRDQTLTDLGRDLHDDIGQLITVLKIHVSSLVKSYPENSKVNEVSSVLNLTSEKVRNLSHSLNNSRIHDFGLYAELQNEVSRIKKATDMDVQLSISDTQGDLDSDKQLILYRIIQEFISNSLKYSGADKLEIKLLFINNDLRVTLSDNGKGFRLEDGNMGSGISNMNARIKMLNALNVSWNSTPDAGTRLQFSIPNLES